MAKRTRAYIAWTPSTGGTRSILQFDVVTSEQQENTAEITDHPVEIGPDVSDHVRSKLDVVTIDGFVSNEPLYDTGERGAAQRSVTLDVKTYDPPFTPTPGALFSALGGQISRLFGSRPTVTQAYVLQFDREFDAVQETHETLRRLIKEHQILEVFTTTNEYKDMVLQRVLLPRGSDAISGGAFSMQFRQLRRVEVKLVKAPVPTEPRAKQAVKKGPQGPEPVKDPVKTKSVAQQFLGQYLK